MSALTYETRATALIVGTGLMGQHMARNVGAWLDLEKLVLVDHAEQINVGGKLVALADFAAEIGATREGATEVVAESLDVTSEEAVRGLFERHCGVSYLMHTAGISPRPLTPPEQLTKEDVLGACEVNPVSYTHLTLPTILLV